jgi:hypothetical protein
VATQPERRGFYYATEARLLAEQIFAIPISQSIVTTNLNPPDYWAKSKSKTGPIDCDVSPPSVVWELDIASVHAWLEEFAPRSTPETPENAFTIAEAARLFNVSRKDLHHLVYSEQIPYVQDGEYRFIPRDYAVDVMRKEIVLPDHSGSNPWPTIQREQRQLLVKQQKGA